MFDRERRPLAAMYRYYAGSKRRRGGVCNSGPGVGGTSSRSGFGSGSGSGSGSSGRDNNRVETHVDGSGGTGAGAGGSIEFDELLRLLQDFDIVPEVCGASYVLELFRAATWDAHDKHQQQQQQQQQQENNRNRNNSRSSSSSGSGTNTNVSVVDAVNYDSFLNILGRIALSMPVPLDVDTGDGTCDESAGNTNGVRADRARVIEMLRRMDGSDGKGKMMRNGRSCEVIRFAVKSGFQ
jgi:hypothetical protein